MLRLFLTFALYMVSCAQNNIVSMCPQEGVTTDVLDGLSITTCDEFYPSGLAIRLPSDTSTIVYGVLESFWSEGGLGPPPGEDATAAVDLRDRNNEMHNVAGSVVQAFLGTFTKTLSAANDDRAQLLVEVTFSNETKTTVTQVQPVLFVPKSTVAKTFRGMTFIGEIINHEPSVVGVNLVDSLTLQFTGNLIGDALIGTRVSSLGDYNSAALQWYTDLFGLQGNVTLTWFPGMHGPGDSELVLHTPANMGSGFMSVIQTTPLFANRTVSQIVQKSPSWEFMVHGNPCNTLQQINGTFSVPTTTTTTTITTIMTTTIVRNEASLGFTTPSTSIAIFAVSAITTLLNSFVSSE